MTQCYQPQHRQPLTQTPVPHFCPKSSAPVLLPGPCLGGPYAKWAVTGPGCAVRVTWTPGSAGATRAQHLELRISDLASRIMYNPAPLHSENVFYSKLYFFVDSISKDTFCAQFPVFPSHWPVLDAVREECPGLVRRELSSYRQKVTRCPGLGR